MRKIGFKDYLKDYLEFNNISNKDFANRIDITPKHLIDILAGNRVLSSKIIDNISRVTNISTDYIYKIEANYRFDLDIESYLEENNITSTEYLNTYNYKELIKINYIDFGDKSNKAEIIKDILKFLRVSSPDKVDEIDKEAYYKSNNDNPKLLLLWLEKCYRETLKQEIGEYSNNNIDILVDYIQECAKKNIFCEEQLIKKFNENGIYFVIQDDVPGSKIRGAFKVHRNLPAIYLTHKHKRIADIYFALFHELAHCKSDFNKAKSTNLISYEKNDLETKADEQAYSWMVSNEYYTKICLDPNYNINLEKKYPKSFIVYRLAHDKKIKYESKEYQEFNYLLEN